MCGCLWEEASGERKERTRRGFQSRSSKARSDSTAERTSTRISTTQEHSHAHCQGTDRHSLNSIHMLTAFLLQFKVKPRKTSYVQPCALELTAMLGCWASAGDIASAKECKEAALRLHECMTKPVRPLVFPLLPTRPPRLLHFVYRSLPADAQGKAPSVVRQLQPRPQSTKVARPLSAASIPLPRLAVPPPLRHSHPLYHCCFVHSGRRARSPSAPLAMYLSQFTFPFFSSRNAPLGSC